MPIYTDENLPKQESWQLPQTQVYQPTLRDQIIAAYNTPNRMPTASNEFSRGLTSTSLNLQASEARQRQLEALRAKNYALADEYKRQADDLEQQAYVNAPINQNFTDALESPSRLPGWAMGALGSMVPTVLPTLASGAAGAFGAGRLAKKFGLDQAKAQALGGWAGGTIPAYQMERNEAISEAMANPEIMANRSLDEIANAAMVKGGLAAGMEALVPAAAGGFMRGASKVLPRGVNRLAKGEVLPAAGTEFLTEGAQSLIGQSTQNYLEGKSLTDYDWTQALNEAAAGAVGGAGMAAPGALGRAGYNWAQRNKENIADKAQALGQTITNTVTGNATRQDAQNAQEFANEVKQEVAVNEAANETTLANTQPAQEPPQAETPARNIEPGNIPSVDKLVQGQTDEQVTPTSIEPTANVVAEEQITPASVEQAAPASVEQAVPTSVEQAAPTKENFEQTIKGNKRDILLKAGKRLNSFEKKEPLQLDKEELENIKINPAKVLDDDLLYYLLKEKNAKKGDLTEIDIKHIAEKAKKRFSNMYQGITDFDIKNYDFGESTLKARKEIIGKFKNINAANENILFVHNFTDMCIKYPEIAKNIFNDDLEDTHTVTDTTGFYDPYLKKVVIYSNNLLLPGQTEGVFFHEVGVHMGLHSILTPQEITNIANQIKRWAKRGNATQEGYIARFAINKVNNLYINKELYKDYKGDANTLYDEEIIANFVGEAFQRGFLPSFLERNNNGVIIPKPMSDLLNKIFDKIKQLLIEMKIVPTKLSPQNLMDLVYGITEKVTNNKLDELKKEIQEATDNRDLFGLISNVYEKADKTDKEILDWYIEAVKNNVISLEEAFLEMVSAVKSTELSLELNTIHLKRFSDKEKWVNTIKNNRKKRKTEEETFIQKALELRKEGNPDDQERVDNAINQLKEGFIDLITAKNYLIGTTSDDFARKAYISFNQQEKTNEQVEEEQNKKQLDESVAEYEHDRDIETFENLDEWDDANFVAPDERIDEVLRERAKEVIDTAIRKHVLGEVTYSDSVFSLLNKEAHDNIDPYNYFRFAEAMRALPEEEKAYMRSSWLDDFVNKSGLQDTSEIMFSLPDSIYVNFYRELDENLGAIPLYKNFGLIKLSPDFNSIEAAVIEEPKASVFKPYLPFVIDYDKGEESLVRIRRNRVVDLPELMGVQKNHRTINGLFRFFEQGNVEFEDNVLNSIAKEMVDNYGNLTQDVLNNMLVFMINAQVGAYQNIKISFDKSSFETIRVLIEKVSVEQSNRESIIAEFSEKALQDNIRDELRSLQEKINNETDNIAKNRLILHKENKIKGLLNILNNYNAYLHNKYVKAADKHYRLSKNENLKWITDFVSKAKIKALVENKYLIKNHQTKKFEINKKKISTKESYRRFLSYLVQLAQTFSSPNYEAPNRNLTIETRKRDGRQQFKIDGKWISDERDIPKNHPLNSGNPRLNGAQWPFKKLWAADPFKNTRPGKSSIVVLKNILPKDYYGDKSVFTKENVDKINAMYSDLVNTHVPKDFVSDKKFSLYFKYNPVITPLKEVPSVEGITSPIQDITEDSPAITAAIFSETRIRVAEFENIIFEIQKNAYKKVYPYVSTIIDNSNTSLISENFDQRFSRNEKAQKINHGRGRPKKLEKILFTDEGKVNSFDKDASNSDWTIIDSVALRLGLNTAVVTKPKHRLELAKDIFELAGFLRDKGVLDSVDGNIRPFFEEELKKYPTWVERRKFLGVWFNETNEKENIEKLQKALQLLEAQNYDIFKVNLFTASLLDTAAHDGLAIEDVLNMSDKLGNALSSFVPYWAENQKETVDIPSDKFAMLFEAAFEKVGKENYFYRLHRDEKGNIVPNALEAAIVLGHQMSLDKNNYYAYIINATESERDLNINYRSLIEYQAFREDTLQDFFDGKLEMKKQKNEPYELYQKRLQQAKEIREKAKRTIIFHGRTRQTGKEQGNGILRDETNEKGEFLNDEQGNLIPANVEGFNGTRGFDFMRLLQLARQKMGNERDNTTTSNYYHTTPMGDIATAIGSFMTMRVPRDHFQTSKVFFQLNQETEQQDILPGFSFIITKEEFIRNNVDPDFAEDIHLWAIGEPKKMLFKQKDYVLQYDNTGKIIGVLHGENRDFISFIDEYEEGTYEHFIAASLKAVLPTKLYSGILFPSNFEIFTYDEGRKGLLFKDIEDKNTLAEYFVAEEFEDWVDAKSLIEDTEFIENYLKDTIDTEVEIEDIGDKDKIYGKESTLEKNKTIFSKQIKEIEERIEEIKEKISTTEEEKELKELETHLKFAELTLDFYKNFDGRFHFSNEEYKKFPPNLEYIQLAFSTIFSKESNKNGQFKIKDPDWTAVKNRIFNQFYLENPKFDSRDILTQAKYAPIIEQRLKHVQTEYQKIIDDDTDTLENKGNKITFLFKKAFGSLENENPFEYLKNSEMSNPATILYNLFTKPLMNIKARFVDMQQNRLTKYFTQKLTYEQSVIFEKIQKLLSYDLNKVFIFDKKMNFKLDNNPLGTSNWFEDYIDLLVYLNILQKPLVKWNDDFKKQRKEAINRWKNNNKTMSYSLSEKAQKLNTNQKTLEIDTAYLLEHSEVPIFYHEIHKGALALYEAFKGDTDRYHHTGLIKLMFNSENFDDYLAKLTPLQLHSVFDKNKNEPRPWAKNAWEQSIHLRKLNEIASPIAEQLNDAVNKHNINAWLYNRGPHADSSSPYFNIRDRRSGYNPLENVSNWALENLYEQSLFYSGVDWKDTIEIEEQQADSAEHAKEKLYLDYGDFLPNGFIAQEVRRATADKLEEIDDIVFEDTELKQQNKSKQGMITINKKSTRETIKENPFNLNPEDKIEAPTENELKPAENELKPAENEPDWYDNPFDLDEETNEIAQQEAITEEELRIPENYSTRFTTYNDARNNFVEKIGKDKSVILETNYTKGTFKGSPWLYLHKKLQYFFPTPANIEEYEKNEFKKFFKSELRNEYVSKLLGAKEPINGGSIYSDFPNARFNENTNRWEITITEEGFKELQRYFINIHEQLKQTSAEHAVKFENTFTRLIGDFALANETKETSDNNAEMYLNKKKELQELDSFVDNLIKDYKNEKISAKFLASTLVNKFKEIAGNKYETTDYQKNAYQENLYSLGDLKNVRPGIIDKNDIMDIFKRTLYMKENTTKQNNENDPKFSDVFFDSVKPSKDAAQDAENYIRHVLGDEVTTNIFHAAKDFIGSFEEKDGKKIINLAMSGDILSTAHHEAMHAFMSTLKTTKPYLYDKMMKFSSRYKDEVVKVLKKYKADKAIESALDDPEELAAYTYQLSMAGLIPQNALTKKMVGKLGQMWLRVAGMFNNAIAQQARDNVDNLEAETKLAALYRRFNAGEYTHSRDTFWQALEQDFVTKQRNKTIAKTVEILGQWGDKLVNASDAVLRRANIPALTQLADLFYSDVVDRDMSENLKKGTTGDALLKYRQLRSKWRNSYNNIIKDLSDADKDKIRIAMLYKNPVEGRDTLKDERLKNAYNEIFNMFDKIYDDMIELGAHKRERIWGLRDNGEEGWLTRWVPITGKDKFNNFPYLWNQNAIRENRIEFTNLLTKEIEAAIKDGRFKGDLPSYDDKGNKIDYRERAWAEELVATMLGEKITAEDMENRYFWVQSNPFGQEAMREENLGFIRDRVQFEKFFEKSMDAVIAEFIIRGSKIAVFQNVFGVGKNNKITELLDTARVALAKEKKLDLIKDKAEIDKLMRPYERAVDSMCGILGNNISPQLRQINAMGVSYQNFRLLALSLFASFQDVVGLAIHGGSIKDQWEGFIRGLREIKNTWTKTESKDEYIKLAEAFGVVDPLSAVGSVAELEGTQHLTGKWAKLSQAFFRWNGLEGWTRGIKAQAFVIAERKIKHWAKEGLNAKNKYDALLFKRCFGDKDPLSIELEEDGSIKNTLENAAAVNRIVADMIMTPTEANRPVWANDPHYMLFAQLKTFSYTLHRVMLRGLGEQFRLGNVRPAGVALAGMVPVALTGYVIKEMILSMWDDDDDTDWKFEPKNLIPYSIDRSGLGGIPLMYMNDILNVDPIRMLGPTFDQIQNILSIPLRGWDPSWFPGKVAYTHTTKNELVSALPASTIIRTFPGMYDK